MEDRFVAATAQATHNAGCVSPLRGGERTSSAPVTEYACPFTSFWEVTASVSAALVIWRRKEAR